MNVLVDALDRHLAVVGEDIQVQRYNGVVLVDTVECRAAVRGYRPEERLGYFHA